MKGKYFLIFTVLVFMLSACAMDDQLSFTSGQVDSYVQEYSDTQYDFLWVFDNSVSMRSKVEYVRDNLSDFLTTLQTRKAINYQMAVTTTAFFSHGGSLSQDSAGNDIVTSMSSNPVADFGAIVNDISSSGSYWEQGLEVAYQAIQNHGVRFSRSGVPLIVIFLTDEEDYSCESDCFGSNPETNSSWAPYGTSRYIDFFNTYKASQGSEVLLFPVVGLPGDSCGIPSSGNRYLEVAAGVDTGGVNGSICLDKLEESYQAIARMIADRGARFYLDDVPNPSTINVLVNSVPVDESATNGWEYDRASNSIVFNGPAIPAKTDIINITYDYGNGS